MNSPPGREAGETGALPLPPIETPPENWIDITPPWSPRAIHYNAEQYPIDRISTQALIQLVSVPQNLRLLQNNFTLDLLNRIRQGIRRGVQGKARGHDGDGDNARIACYGPSGSGKTISLLTVTNAIHRIMKEEGAFTAYHTPPEYQVFDPELHFWPDLVEAMEDREDFPPAYVLLCDDPPKYNDSKMKPFFQKALFDLAELATRCRHLLIHPILTAVDPADMPLQLCNYILTPLPGHCQHGVKSKLALYINEGGAIVPAGHIVIPHPSQVLQTPLCRYPPEEFIQVLDAYKNRVLGVTLGQIKQTPYHNALGEMIEAASLAELQEAIVFKKTIRAFIGERKGTQWQKPQIEEAVELLHGTLRKLKWIDPISQNIIPYRVTEEARQNWLHILQGHPLIPEPEREFLAPAKPPATPTPGPPPTLPPEPDWDTPAPRRPVANPAIHALLPRIRHLLRQRADDPNPARQFRSIQELSQQLDARPRNIKQAIDHLCQAGEVQKSHLGARWRPHPAETQP